MTDDLKLRVLTAAYQQSWYFLYLVVVFEIAGFLAAVVFTILMFRLLWHAGSWFARTQPGGRPYIGGYPHGHVPNAPVQVNEKVYDAALEAEADEAIKELTDPDFDDV